MPPMPEKVLTVNYGLPPQYVFMIIRGSLPPIYELTEDQFKQKVHEFRSVLFSYLDKKIENLADMDSANEYWSEINYLKQKKEDAERYMNPELYTIFWYMSL